MDFGRKMLRKKTFAHEQCFLETMNSTREPCIVEASQDLGLDLSGLDRKADARAKKERTPFQVQRTELNRCCAVLPYPLNS